MTGATRSVRFVDASTLRRALPVAAAIDALQQAFGDEPLPEAPHRSHLETPEGTLLLMPATGAAGTGVKLVAVNPGNPGRGLPLVQGLYMLFAPETLEPEAVIDGAELTALRTSALSGLATRLLARPDATRLAIFGAGTQGNAHLDAMRAVRPIERLWVVSRTEQRAAALVARARSVGIDAQIAGPGSLADADLVCTCTTSDRPLFAGAALADGAHVNAVGAYRPDARELDTAAVVRAKVVVETREAALAEAGDLLIPIGEGAIAADHVVADLRDVVRGMPVRSGPHDVTLFKSVGVAFEDLAVARAAVDRLG